MDLSLRRAIISVSQIIDRDLYSFPVVKALDPSNNLAEDQGADLIAKYGSARVSLQPFITGRRLTLRKYRQPTEILPAHFSGGGHCAARIQIEGNECRLT